MSDPWRNWLLSDRLASPSPAELMDMYSTSPARLSNIRRL